MSLYNNEYWKEFKNKYNPIIYSMIRKTFNIYNFYPNKEDIEDCYQDFYIKLIKNDYRNIKKYNENLSSINTWLSIIIQSIVIDNLRKHKNELNNIELDIYFEEIESINLFDEIKNILTEREECVLSLIFKEEKEISEISFLLEIKESTIRVIKKNALEKLRKVYKGNNDGKK
jgi:RNA polymerase sigma factor (sigma-70 family)